MNVQIHHGLSDEERAAATTASSRVADLIADLQTIGVEAEVAIGVTISLSIVKPAPAPSYDARPQTVIGPN